MLLTARRAFDRIQLHRRRRENVGVHREAGVNQLFGCWAGNENSMHASAPSRQLAGPRGEIHLVDDSVLELELRRKSASGFDLICYLDFDDATTDGCRTLGYSRGRQTQW